MEAEEMTAKYKTPDSILGLKRALLGQQAKLIHVLEKPGHIPTSLGLFKTVGTK